MFEEPQALWRDILSPMMRQRVPGIMLVAAISSLDPAPADACGNAVLATDNHQRNRSSTMVTVPIKA